MWYGPFRCPYRSTPDGTLVSQIGNFVRYFVVRDNQTYATEVPVIEISNWLKPNRSNYIIVHGFNDAVRKGGSSTNVTD